jgi:hypothetical protein
MQSIRYAPSLCLNMVSVHSDHGQCRACARWMVFLRGGGGVPAVVVTIALEVIENGLETLADIGATSSRRRRVVGSGSDPGTVLHDAPLGLSVAADDDSRRPYRIPKHIRDASSHISDRDQRIPDWMHQRTIACAT